MNYFELNQMNNLFEFNKPKIKMSIKAIDVIRYQFLQKNEITFLRLHRSTNEAV